MPEYIFEIQSLIKVKVEADNDVEDRMDIIEHLDRYADQMVNDPYVSGGELVKAK